MGKLLTQDEVHLLPDGTEVIITWGGGNGPHHYLIEQGEEFTYANPIDDPKGPMRYYNAITYAGFEKWNTHVEVVE